MNKFLLFAAALSIAATATGQTAVSGHDLVKERTETGSAAKLVKRAHSRVADVITEKGAVAKRICSPAVVKNNTVNPRVFSKAPAKTGELDGSDILFESFEGWDGTTKAWVPEGWTVESKGDIELGTYEKWGPSEANPNLPSPTDGKYYYGISYSDKSQDEWLISPVVSLPEEPKGLYFDISLDPIFFFNLENVDWDASQFIGEPEVVFNIIVNIREEGGEWAQLINFADRYKGYSLDDLFMISTGDKLQPESASLADYTGKKIQIAFQYVGTDGQTCFIDNIRIGNPQLEAPVYMMPFSTQYWGFTRNLDALNMGVAALPVYTDLMWMSYDYVDGATYTWEYNDPENTDNWLTTEGDELFASYATDYTNDFTTRNNLYYLPKLTVSAPGASAATYQNPAKYMQMGGKADFLASTSDGGQVMLNMGLVPFNRVAEDLGVYTYREDFGTPILPIFGYAPGVDQFWTDYTFNGGEEEGEGVKLTSIFNFLYSSASPMVVTAADLFAYTTGVGENVEFTCTIYPINDDFEPMLDSPVATATLKGKDISVLAEGDQSPDLSCLTFEFDKAVVLDDTYPAYVVMIAGFNNPDIAYFCPFQSLYPADAPLALGWVAKEITFQGETRVSYSPMSDAEGEALYTSFAINMEACLPWLQCDTEELEVSNNGTKTGLDSYYAGEEFTVSAPDWAEVTVEGRYANTVLTVNAEYTETAREGEITISAPGVSKTFKLLQPAGTGMSGINEIISGDNGAVEAVYNLNGQKVNQSNMPAGVYLIKRASGKVEKTIVK